MAPAGWQRDAPHLESHGTGREHRSPDDLVGRSSGVVALAATPGARVAARARGRAEPDLHRSTNTPGGASTGGIHLYAPVVLLPRLAVRVWIPRVALEQREDRRRWQPHAPGRTTELDNLRRIDIQRLTQAPRDMRPGFGLAQFDLGYGHPCHTGTVGQRLLRHMSPLPRFPKRQHSNHSLSSPLGPLACGGTGCQRDRTGLPIFPLAILTGASLSRKGVRSAFRLGNN